MHGNNPATQQGPGIPRPACIPSPPPPPRPGPNAIPDRTEKAQHPETPNGQEKKTKGWASRAWDDLKTFRATILTGTAAGTAMATVYMILAMDARGAGYHLHFAGYAATAAFLGLGIPLLLFAMLRTRE